MVAIRPCGSALQCRAAEGRWLSGSSRGELTAGGSHGVALVICTLTVPTGKLHKAPWNFMCRFFKGITCQRGEMSRTGVTPGAQRMNKTIRWNPRCVWAARRSTQQFGSWVLCHADSQPGAARVDQNATSSQRMTWGKCQNLCCSAHLIPQPAVRFRWHSSVVSSFDPDRTIDVLSMPDTYRVLLSIFSYCQQIQGKEPKQECSGLSLSTFRLPIQDHLLLQKTWSKAMTFFRICLFAFLQRARWQDQSHSLICPLSPLA